MTVSSVAPLAGDLVAVVAHASAVPAHERALLADRLRARTAPAGLLFVTCHRAEAYFVASSMPDELHRQLPTGTHVLLGRDAARHAISVACGLESAVVGEDQVLHQFRSAVTSARTSGSLDPALDRLFALALSAGRRARSWRAGPRRSLADVALERALCGASATGRRIDVIGAGKMGRLAARAAGAAGARVSVASRTHDRAAALAGAVGADIAPFAGDASIGSAAVVIVALAGPWHISEAASEALRRTSAVVVDLSSPAATPPALRAALVERFISIDDLAAVPVDSPSDAYVARVRALVAETTDAFQVWLDGHERREAIRTLAERVERERAAELDDLWRRLPNLGTEERSLIEGMSRHLAARLLREPLQRLGDDPDGHRERAARELFGL